MNFYYICFLFKTLKHNFMSIINSDEIIKQNKLIAEFMGGKYDKDVSFPIHPDDIWLPFHGIVSYKTIEIGKGKILSYHDCWKWLMPVVVKISSLDLKTKL